ncbi:MAG: hypothetical protein ACI4VP_04345 [Clostridia bacterium]
MKNAKIVCNVGVNIVNLQQTEPVLKQNIQQNTNQKGITIIALIITIIVMLILASVTIYVGTDSLAHSKMVRFVSYMQMIQKKVDEIAENGDYDAYGVELQESGQTTLQEILTLEGSASNVADFKYFDSNAIANQLEIDGIDDEIAINFTTREVFSLIGIEYEDKMYYSQYNLPGGQKLKQQTETTNRDLTFTITTQIDGLNAIFQISDIKITNGALYYGKETSENNIKWTLANNYTKTGQTENINITESGTYYLKLVDNVNKNENIPSETISLRLTNKPKLKGDLGSLSPAYNYSNLELSQNWAYATDSETSYIYVWIPRYAYKIDSDGNIIKDENGKIILEFLRGTSDVTTSGGYIDSNWKVPSQFTNGTTEFTGVWVQVESANQEGIDIIDILSSGIIL